MLTKIEGDKIRAMKAKVLAGKYVSNADKQWILTTLARVQEPVRADVVQRAAEGGFDITGVVIAHSAVPM